MIFFFKLAAIFLFFVDTMPTLSVFLPYVHSNSIVLEKKMTEVSTHLYRLFSDKST